MRPAADCKTEHMEGAGRPGRLGRLVRPTDFERLLKSPSCARSARFALHHVAGAPSQPAPPHRIRPSQLSTGLPQVDTSLVDNPGFVSAASPAAGNTEGGANQPTAANALASGSRTQQATHWLGFVLPKRWARRAVTRNLVRRLARASFAARLGGSAQGDTGREAVDVPGGLPPGLWALRLKSAIDAQRFHSASSPLLRASLHEELQTLWQRAARQALSSRAGTTSPSGPGPAP